ncbi:hypothetical protein CJ263_14485 [Maribacter cobaltidurans]|uniref:Bacterial Pleckstrin homology domain-containing protein n=2 Tax=Maribacter cobaltidurans TaxID=1178778 RepID=A0A223V7R0_9FLAO|nr:hypothetical protein CJ263_14485 [Maribacter cobaltidurans]
MVYPIYQAINSGELDSMAKNVLILTFFFVLVILVLVYRIALSTQIDEKGIHFRFFPFQRNNKVILWADMDKCYTRKYSPIGEFGGWGYRGIGRKKKAYNIRGNMGIQVVLKTGKMLLIGTQKPNEAQQTINRYFNQDERI